MTTLADRMAEIVAIAATRPLAVTDEARLSASFRTALEASSLVRADFERGRRIESEITLKCGAVALGRVDFLWAGIAIELKRQGTPLSIARRLRRYAHSPRVDGLVLVTARAMALPEHINGRPALVAHIGEGLL